VQIVARDHDSLARRCGDGDGRQRMRDRLVPGGVDLFDRAPHADGIDLRGGRQRPDRDRHVEAASVGSDHIGEQEGAALVLVQPALELPAHQRVKLGVLVDLAVDANQESRQVLLEVRGRAAALRRLICTLIGAVEHQGTSCEEGSSLNSRKSSTAINAIAPRCRWTSRFYQIGPCDQNLLADR
jgi:hypothetical protein